MSTSKRQQSAAKRARELAVKERRELKRQKKDEARRAKRSVLRREPEAHPGLLKVPLAPPPNKGF